MPASLRSATSTTAIIGSSATICRDLAAGHGERRLPHLDRHVVHDPGPWRTHGTAFALGLGGSERGLRDLELGFELTRSSLGMVPFSISFRLASSSVRR